tara:strand:+ start:38 stop:571 length:534 start_codon:yes stop_codon:yes gene_type:complete
MKVKHNVEIVIDDYPFSEKLKESVLPLLENYTGGISRDLTNVKAIHTEWNWQFDNTQIKKLKLYLVNLIKKNFDFNFKSIAKDSSDGNGLEVQNLWGNVYNKGDYAIPHDHFPYAFSFAYFLKSKWYYPSLIFSDSGKRIRPKEGRFVIFPAYLIHHVPKHRFKDTRITLSGNVSIV